MPAISILDEMIKTFAAFAPNFAGAVIVLILGWILSKIIAKIVKRVLRTIGADKLAERINEIELFSKNNIKIVPSTLLSKIVYYLLLFITFFISADILNMEVVSNLMADILNYLPLLFSGFLLFVIGVVAADFIKGIVKTTCESLAIPSASMIANIVFYFILINIFILSLKQAAVKTDFIETNLAIIFGGIVGAFAIGYGLASRGLMANYLASFYNKPKIKVGESIQIMGIKGEILEMDNNVIVLKAPEGQKVIIPISKLASEPYEIFSGKNKSE
ncbi:MAG TPA: mechanosensitive ion channel [Flavilitoribacter sp.]|nr:mechanosensitive ion channel [Flavilitoribacter sp.]